MHVAPGYSRPAAPQVPVWGTLRKFPDGAYKSPLGDRSGDIFLYIYIYILIYIYIYINI